MDIILLLLLTVDFFNALDAVLDSENNKKVLRPNV